MLGRIALRIAGVRALKGRTLVGDEVLDSHMSALDVDASGAITTDQEKPFLAVYCEQSVIEDASRMRGLHGSGMVEFVIEAGIAATMTALNPDTGATTIVGIGIPSTDDAMEFFLDVCGREAVDALSDPDDMWAEIWRGLSTAVVKIERKRQANAESGTRFAAHQTVLTLALIDDPIFGEPLDPDSVWLKFFAMLEQEEPALHAKLAPLVFAAEPTSEATLRRRRHGMTLDEARILFGAIVEPPATLSSGEASVALTVDRP